MPVQHCKSFVVSFCLRNRFSQPKGKDDDVAVQPNMSTPFLIVAVVIIVLLINLMSNVQIHSAIGLGHTIQRNFQDPLNIYANSSSSSSSPLPQCLDFNEGGGLDVLIEKADIVYLLAALKAGGSSLREFTNQCFGSAGCIGSGCFGDFINRLEMPKFVAAHTNKKKITELIKETPRNALLIVSYRDETDRLASAIKHVMGWVCQRERAKELIKPLQIERGQRGDVNMKKTCVLDEKEFVEKIIRPRNTEIGGSTLELFSCEFHRSVIENLPNIVMISMESLSTLMGVLKNKYCPDVTVKHKSSEALEKNWAYYLKIKNGTKVLVNDWLVHKGNFLEYILRLKESVTCQGKTRQMEDQVFACPHEAIHNFYLP